MLQTKLEEKWQEGDPEPDEYKNLHLHMYYTTNKKTNFYVLINYEFTKFIAKILNMIKFKLLTFIHQIHRIYLIYAY